MSDKPNRRDALKALTAATGALSLAALPDEWTTPVINAGKLPPHAQTSLVCTDWRLEVRIISESDGGIGEYSPIVGTAETDTGASSWLWNCDATGCTVFAIGSASNVGSVTISVTVLGVETVFPAFEQLVEDIVVAVNLDTGAWDSSVLLPAIDWDGIGCIEPTPSDRNLKSDIYDVDQREVLERLSQVPIATWSYIADDGDVTHMGPMAQDFFAAFGLGEDDRHIFSVDASGVAMAAIQGLFALVQEKDAQLAQQQTLIEQLDTRLAALEAAAGQRNGRLQP